MLGEKGVLGKQNIWTGFIRLYSTCHTVDVDLVDHFFTFFLCDSLSQRCHDCEQFAGRYAAIPVLVKQTEGFSQLWQRVTVLVLQSC